MIKSMEPDIVGLDGVRPRRERPPMPSAKPTTISTIVARFPYTTVKKRVVDHEDGTLPHIAYDIWTWNVYKLKWTRMGNHGCGFGSLSDASISAKRLSAETEDMLKKNQTPPPAL